MGAMEETQPPVSESAPVSEFAGTQASRDEEVAHDVLAAEAFAMPAPDPSLHHGPVVLPDDPTGIAEPHDVLAAEEFAMPAPRESRSAMPIRPERASHQIGIAVAAGLLLLIVIRRLIARRR
jgi:hypothetical protein